MLDPSRLITWLRIAIKLVKNVADYTLLVENVADYSIRGKTMSENIFYVEITFMVS